MFFVINDAQRNTHLLLIYWTCGISLATCSQINAKLAVVVFVNNTLIFRGLEWYGRTNGTAWNTEKKYLFFIFLPLWWMWLLWWHHWIVSKPFAHLKFNIILVLLRTVDRFVELLPQVDRTTKLIFLKIMSGKPSIIHFPLLSRNYYQAADITHSRLSGQHFSVECAREKLAMKKWQQKIPHCLYHANYYYFYTFAQNIQIYFSVSLLTG